MTWGLGIVLALWILLVTLQLERLTRRVQKLESRETQRDD